MSGMNLWLWLWECMSTSVLGYWPGVWGMFVALGWGVLREYEESDGWSARVGCWLI